MTSAALFVNVWSLFSSQCYLMIMPSSYPTHEIKYLEVAGFCTNSNVTTVAWISFKDEQLSIDCFI